MEYPPPPPVPSDVDPATLAAFPLEYIAGEQQAELMAAIKALGDRGDFPEARPRLGLITLAGTPPYFRSLCFVSFLQLAQHEFIYSHRYTAL